jgi:hypothetical protein
MSELSGMEEHDIPVTRKDKEAILQNQIVS